MKSTEITKDLIAQHNLTDEEYKKTMECLYFRSIQWEQTSLLINRDH